MNVNPIKLAYRGVLIERPCVGCDTVDIHFEGKCNSGPCQHVDDGIKCRAERFTTNRNGTWGHDYMYGHEWVAPTYYPADFEWANNESSTLQSDLAQEAFIRILDKVKQIGQPEYYTCDLFRDFQRLTGQNKQFPTPAHRFVWAVRQGGCGTDLFTPEMGINRYYDTNPHQAYFAYDGRTHGPLGDFVEVNLDTARTLLSIWRADDLHPVQRIINTHECYVDYLDKPDGAPS